MEGAGTRTGTGLGAVDYLGLTMWTPATPRERASGRIAGAPLQRTMSSSAYPDFCSVTKAGVSAGSRNPVFTVDLDEGRSEVLGSLTSRASRAGWRSLFRPMGRLQTSQDARSCRCQRREVIVVNERLRQAILDADLSLEDLAGEIGIDPKTAEQWVTRGRVCRRLCRLSTTVGAGRSGSTRASGNRRLESVLSPERWSRLPR
jgi:hypothetical protein